MTSIEIASLVGMVVAISGGVYFGLVKQRNSKSSYYCHVTSDLCMERHKSLEVEIRQIHNEINELKGDIKDVALRVRSGEIANQVAEQLKKKL